MLCITSSGHMLWHTSVDQWCEEQKELMYGRTNHSNDSSWCGRRLPTVLLQLCHQREMIVMNRTLLHTAIAAGLVITSYVAYRVYHEFSVVVWLAYCAMLILVLYVATAVCSVPRVGRWLDVMREWLF